MDLGYSFNMDDQQLGKSIRQLRKGITLYSVFSGITLAAAISVVFLLDDHYIFRTVSFVFDLYGYIFIVLASFLFFFGLNNLANCFGGKAEKILSITKNMQLAFIVIYITGGIIGFILVWFYPFAILIKNLLAIPIISIMLFSLSLNFNYLGNNNFKTNLLFAPVVTLPVPSLLGTVFALIMMFTAWDFNDFDNFLISVFILHIYLLVALLASFIELYYVMKKFALSLNVEFVPARIKKDVNEEVDNISKDKSKEKLIAFEQTTPAKK